MTNSTSLPEDDFDSNTKESPLTCGVPLDKCGCRLDQFAAEMFPQYSRSRLQQWIREGNLTLDGRTVKPNAKLAGGELISLLAVEREQAAWLAEDIPLNIVYEDEYLLVINKPSGLVVHPAAGNYSGTLLNGLLHHNPVHAKLPRAGIVHRLDKDTTGLMVVAKSEIAQQALVQQLQARTVKRNYQAIVHGSVRASGFVCAAIGRHPSVRTKMAVLERGGKEALTHYQIVKDYTDFTHLELKLETGRTHQIRVHMAHLGHPLIGDVPYGKKMPEKLLRANPDLSLLAEFPRQALHAYKLGLIHPISREACQWQADVPADMQQLLTLLSA
ncbi:ribosomal large subunit pseudouridine synthase D [Alteromonadaceae bacterium Bs31]|nr:ribosomal large subunit pseudouridine synthase D [Alteromonadaceae bacterium Bs31]